MKTKRLIVLLAFFPSLALAFSLKDSSFKDVVYEVLGIINLLIPILSVLAFIVFFWGLSKFILNSDSQAEIQKGKNYMFWGVIALFVLITFRTIIGLVAGDLDIGGSTVIPQLPTGSNSQPVNTDQQFNFSNQ
jgi:hypothetical protein